MAETDPTKLKEKLAALEAAIFTRFQELANSSDYRTERDALHLAVDNLRHIQLTRLGYPTWEKRAG